MLLSSLALGSLVAQSLRGTIRDAHTKEELIGATVVIKGGAQRGAITGFDGSFMLKDLPEGGAVTLICSYVGYQPREFQAKLSGGSVEVLLTEERQMLNDVLVMADMVKNTDHAARFLEKNALNVSNVVSARSMEISPDLNVANVLQRVSGVTMERSSSGDGQYAVLRGMDKRYNYSLVNGVKIPSPDDKNRYIPLDIFPSELLDRLEVTKSLSADMEGDATGGVINMVMKDAPPRRGFQMNLASGYNALFFDRGFSQFDFKNITREAPRYTHGAEYNATVDDFSRAGSKVSDRLAALNLIGGVMYGDRFFKDRLGVVVAGSFQNLHKGNNSVFFSDVMTQDEQAIRLSDKRDRQFSELQTQYGVHNKLDFRINTNHKIALYNAFIGSRSAQVRYSATTDLGTNYNPSVGNSSETYETRARLNIQQIYNSTLQGEHQLNAFRIDWSGVYSFAKNNRPDQTFVKLENIRTNYIDYVTAASSERRWEDNRDRDLAGYLNINHSYNLGFANLKSKAGALYRDKARTNRFVQYDFRPHTNSSRPVQGVDFNEIDEIDWRLSTPRGSVGPLNYDAAEKIAAAYLMETLEHKTWSVTAGVRMEHTLQSYTQEFPLAGDDPYGEQNYWDLLPSIAIKYAPNGMVNLRASYFKSINRPGFFEIVPYTIINEDFLEFGNKELKHAKIDNIDFRWEYFPSSTEQLMVGLFYKKIKDPIEYAYHTINNRQFGYGPKNIGDAVNYGVEVDMIKFMRNVGIKMNYTYTHSAITTSKVLYGRDEEGRLARFDVDQTRPLVNQAPHVANVSLMYKDTRRNWDAQVALSYSGDKIVIASHFLDSDYWEEGAVTLDLSFEKRFKSDVSLFVKANNLLNTPVRRYVKTTNEYNANFDKQDLASGKTVIREDYYGFSCLIGARYRF